MIATKKILVPKFFDPKFLWTNNWFFSLAENLASSSLKWSSSSTCISKCSTLCKSWFFYVLLISPNWIINLSQFVSECGNPSWACSKVSNPRNKDAKRGLNFLKTQLKPKLFCSFLFQLNFNRTFENEIDLVELDPEICLHC